MLSPQENKQTVKLQKSVKSVKSAESAETIESGVEQAPSAGTDAAAGLSLQNRDSTAPASEPSAEPEAPNYALADLGAVMADLRQEVPAEVRDVDFEVAEVGADMIAEPVAEVPVSVTDVTFDLAEVGADIGDQEEQVVHDTPDISHLGLVEE